MVAIGSKVINKKTNKIHIVDEIEIINGETLIFTKDIKCFPIEFCEEIFGDDIPSKKRHIHESSDVVNLLQSLHLVIDISEFPSVPYESKKTNFFSKILSNIRLSFR
jgi:hypothetical protein